MPDRNQNRVEVGSTRAEQNTTMSPCNVEFCTEETSETCRVCLVFAERDRLERFWFKGGLLFDGVQALKCRRVFAFLRRYALLLLSGLLFILTLNIPDQPC